MIHLGLRRHSLTLWRWWLHRFEPVRWLKDPGDVAGKKVCLLVSYADAGVVSRHTLAWAEAWHQRGFAVVLVIAADRPTDLAFDPTTAPYLAGMLARRNIGYDFGSWVYGLAATRGIRKASLLAMTNDSVYGPLDGFDRMLSRVAASGGEVIGITESFERSRHLQSFLVFYTPAALATTAFKRFWQRIPTGGREEVIVDGELKLLSTMLQHGFKVDILFPCDPSFAGNPTLERWRQLLDDAFPFVKIQLLRDNPKGADIDGWDVALRRHGYDPDQVRAHLGAGFATSAAGRALSVHDDVRHPARASSGLRP